MAADDLETDREPVEEAGGHRDRRIAVQVGREREAAVVARSGLDAPEHRWQGTVGVEGHDVDDVDLVRPSVQLEAQGEVHGGLVAARVPYGRAVQ